MKQLLSGIWQWSWFSDEKQIDFNGLFLNVGEHKILIDPPLMTAEASTFIRRQGVSTTFSSPIGTMLGRQRRIRLSFVARCKYLTSMRRTWI